MPGSKNKPTTSTPEPATSDPSSHVLPDQQVFHQYLRTLAQSAVRIVIETAMREELDKLIGAAWGESSPKRKGGSPRCLSPGRAPTKWAKWPKRSWESLPVPAPLVASTRRSANNLKSGANALSKSTGASCTQDAGAFQHSSWRQGRFHHHFNRIRRRSGRKQRDTRPASLRRGG
jgi:hypothetical protein